MPIRLRLTLLFAAASAGLLLVFGAFVYVRLGQNLLDAMDLGLRARADAIVALLEDGGSPSLGSAGRLLDADESFAQVLDGEGQVIASSRSATPDSPMIPAATLTAVVRPTFLERAIASVDSDPLRLLVVPTHLSGERAFLVLGATLGDRNDALRGLRDSFLLSSPLALLVMAGAAWVVVGAALRPVERIRREAEAVSASEPGRRLTVRSTRDELGRLAATLNEMLGRLQEAREREHRFVDEASHELRTPLSVLKVELDLALARERSPAELEAALRAAAQETDRLVRLAEDLLVLARVERGRLALRREVVDLTALVGSIAPGYAARAARADVRLETHVAPGTSGVVDPARLRQVLENLLDNAVRHTPAGGLARLSAARVGDVLRISVDDAGPGFSPDLLRRAFDPFAGAGSEDAIGAEGTGLGLAIVQAIVQSHGGTATVENVPGGGARVTVLLPAT